MMKFTLGSWLKGLFSSGETNGDENVDRLLEQHLTGVPPLVVSSQLFTFENKIRYFLFLFVRLPNMNRNMSRHMISF